MVDPLLKPNKIVLAGRSFMDATAEGRKSERELYPPVVLMLLLN